MVVGKLARLPRRLRDDLVIAATLKNWPEVLSSKLRHRDYNELRFRSGAVLASPKEVRLELVFHEVWVDKMYSPAGYEVHENDTVLDVGANIGVFSFLAISSADNVRVVAFEPFPQNYQWLRKNIENNGLDGIDARQIALSGDSEPKTLYVSDAWVSHSLNPGDVFVDSITINSTTLNSILDELGSCQLMKIDCEGSEYDIFYASSPETLARIERIVGEYHEIDDLKQNGAALCVFLEANGFEITHFEAFKDGTGRFCARRI